MQQACQAEQPRISLPVSHTITDQASRAGVIELRKMLADRPLMKTLISGLLFLIGLSSVAQPLSGYRIGDEIYNFTLLNVTNQTAISLSDYNDKKVVVVIFTNNNCPYAKL